MPARQVRRRFYSRTTLPIFTVGAVLLAAGIFGAWQVHRLHKRGSEIISENVASIRAAEELETITRELRYRLKRYLSSGNERHLEHIEDLMPRGSVAIDKTLALATTAREKQLVEQIRKGFQHVDLTLQELTEPAARGRHELLSDLADDVIPNEVLIRISRYAELNEQELDHSNERNQATANQLMFGLLLLGTCGGVAGLIAGYGMARLVNRTIVQLAIPIRDAAGKLSQVSGPVTVAAEPGFDDLESMLKKVSDHVATVVERLQESERDRLRAEQLAAVGQLAAGLAHELRNPLTSMKAILQLASDPAELSGRDLEVLREEAGRLERSVQSLLDFARPNQPHMSPTDLNALLADTAHLAQRRAQRQGIQLICHPPTAEIQLLADPGQLRQVALNLLLNAIDVTPRGGAIRIEALWATACTGPVIPAGRNGPQSPFNAMTKSAIIRVSDSGPGLPPELGLRIFEPFVTSKETGTGLGLSICRRILEAHGGGIMASNRPGGGAVFEAHLPAVPEEPKR